MFKTKVLPDSYSSVYGDFLTSEKALQREVLRVMKSPTAKAALAINTSTQPRCIRLTGFRESRLCWWNITHF
jgi:hypothetical protein